MEVGSHIGREDFLLSFSEVIYSAYIYIADNPGAPDSELDFGIPPVIVSGNVEVEGTRFRPTTISGGLIRLDGIDSAVLSHTAHPPVLDLDFAIVVTTAPIQLGDVNIDGQVNLLDVDRFAHLVSSGGFQSEADLNQDGSVDLLDVALMVDALIGNP